VIVEINLLPGSPVVSLSQASESLSFPGEPGLGILLPYLAGMDAERTVITGDLLSCWLRAVASGAECPECGTWSERVHATYGRCVKDSGIGGRRILLRILVRRLACGNGACAKKTFAERFPGLAGPRARMTGALGEMLTAAALLSGGRPGARLCGALLAVEVSRHYLNRLVMALPDPDPVLVRVLGIDDFSIRRGHTYATILVDMETRQPVDVLPDRETATVGKWLEAHPGTEIICRDRACGYAEAASNAAPDAVQVADRWHLWHNLCEHARDAVARHRDCLAGHCSCGTPQQQAERDEAERERQQEDKEKAAAALEPAAVEARIRARHAEITALRAAGLDMPAAAARLGLQKRITWQYWDTPGADTLLARLRSLPPGLRPFEPLIRAQWAAGITSGPALCAAVTAAGFTGTKASVRRAVARYRLAADYRKPPEPPTPRQVTGWITRPEDDLASRDAAALRELTRRCPGLAALKTHVSAFAEILTGLQGKDALGTWLAASENDPRFPELASFALGIRRDHDAVVNGLTLIWNSGLVEGLNTRTKLLKRKMYGRATFALLRKRILTGCY
jgi:transposase